MASSADRLVIELAIFGVVATSFLNGRPLDEPEDKRELVSAVLEAHIPDQSTFCETDLAKYEPAETLKSIATAEQWSAYCNLQQVKAE